MPRGQNGNAIAGNEMQNAMSYLLDNMPQGEAQTRRGLRVLRTRGGAHDTRVREVELSAAGLCVL